MTVTETPAKTSRLWLAVVLLFVAVRALPNLTYPLSNNPPVYLLIAQGLLHGQKLYRDLWDIKPPGILWVYVPIVKLFGTAMWSAGAVDILWLLAMSFCIFRFTERSMGTATAAAAVVVNACWHCRAGYTHAAETEDFMTLFAFASYFAIRARSRCTLVQHFAAGILLGGAFWIKYNALAFLPFVLLAPYLDPSGLDALPVQLRLSVPWRTWATRAATVLAGLAAAILAVLAYFWRAGLWTYFRRDHLEIVPRYGGVVLPTGVIEYLVQPVAAAIIGLGVWTLLASAAAVIVARGRREFGRLAPAFLGELCGYATAATQLRVNSYEFETCYPFASMMWAYVGVKVYEGTRALTRERAGRGWAVRILVWALIAAALFWPVQSEIRNVATGYQRIVRWWQNPDRFYAADAASYPLEKLVGEMKVIEYLKEKSAPGDSLYIWGVAPRIYLFTKLPSPSRFIVNHPLMGAWGRPEWREELVHDLEKSPPTFIVVSRRDGNPGVLVTRLSSEQFLDVYPELKSFISEGYEQVAAWPDFVIYRRKVSS